MKPEAYFIMFGLSREEIDKLNKELGSIKGKLSNANFVDRAPVAVVAKEQQRLEKRQVALKKLQQQQLTIQAL